MFTEFVLFFLVFVHNSCSTKHTAGFLHQLFLQNKLMKQPHFWHAGTNSHNLKEDDHLWGLAWSKNECGQSGDGTLKLTVSEE